jgi:type IV pilus assembly protein PilM
MIRALGPAGVAGDGTSAVFVNVGGLTNLAVHDGTACRFTRVSPGGLEGIAADLAERRGLTLEHSRQWLSHVGLEVPVELVDGDPAIVADARTAMADGVRRIADEIRHSIDYHRVQEGGMGVERAVLTGPAVHVSGFAESLGTELALPVEARAVSEAEPGALGGLPAGQLTVAAGLAVEEIAA